MMNKRVGFLPLLSGVSSMGLMGIFSCCVPVAAIPVSNAYISFAGAGGDFSSRAAIFRVPEVTTVTPVENGLRLYDVHLAKMIEVTNSFCQEQKRESDYVVHWNYEAEGGKVFMGEISLSCKLASETLAKFGTSGTEEITINHRGEPFKESISVLNINGENAQDFMTLVQSLNPECIDMTPKICPGDRLE